MIELTPAIKTYLIIELNWLSILPYSIINSNLIYFHCIISINGIIIIPKLRLALSNISYLLTLTERNEWIQLMKNNTSDFCNLILELLTIIIWSIIRVMLSIYIFIIIYKNYYMNPIIINIIPLIILFVLNMLTIFWGYQLLRNIKCNSKNYLFYDISQVIDNINDYEVEDFIISNYVSHPQIKVEMGA